MIVAKCEVLSSVKLSYCVIIVLSISCAMVLVTPEALPTLVREWLHQIDTDKNGRLTRQELKDALRTFHLRFKGLRARFAVKDADFNSNGVIDLNNEEEMKEMIAYVQKHWGKHMIPA